MATLERYVSYTKAILADDIGPYVLDTFPAVPADSVALITRVYFYFTGGAFGTNISVLEVNGQSVYFNSLTASTAIINPNTAIVFQEQDILTYRFRNDNAGQLTITIFYRLIPAQDTDNSIKYLRNVNHSILGSVTLLNNDQDTPMFVKSLSFYNTTAIMETSNLSKSGSVLLSSTSDNTNTVNLLTNDDQVFLLPSETLTLSVTGGGLYYYCLSYYYDPLYI